MDITQSEASVSVLANSGVISHSDLLGLFDDLDKAFLVLDSNFKTCFSNQHARALFSGFDTEQVLSVDFLTQLCDPLDALKMIDVLEKASHQADAIFTTSMRMHYHGERVLYLWRAVRYASNSNQILLVGSDISSRFEYIQEVRKTQENFHNLVELNQTGIVVVDMDGVIQYVNPSARKLLSRLGKKLVGSNLGMPVVIEKRKEIQFIRNDGTLGYAELTASRSQWRGNNAMLLMLHDITELKESEKKIRSLAYNDSLTNLPNRLFFMERLGQTLLNAQRRNGTFSLLYMDLDKFKQVNDTLGHSCGDRLLQIVAVRLKSCLRESDTVARLGGDEFGIILEGTDSKDRISAISKKIIKKINKPIELSGKSVYVQASIGVSTFPNNGEDVSVLIRRADISMYAAKSKAFGERVSFYDSSLEKKAEEAFEIDNSLQSALRRNQFRMVYQPKINMSDGSLSGFEALLRWHHPEKGIIGPDLFIPRLEEMGLICDVGRWIFQSVVEQIAIWKKKTGDTVSVAVNVSAVQLEDESLPQFVFDELARAGLPPSAIDIELTESAVMRHETMAIDILKSFTDLGFKIFLDDFGTGASSLSIIRKLPLYAIKIDKSLVVNIDSDEENFALTQAAINMAKALGIKIVAEGIESEEIHDLICHLGCEYGQGYYYGRPQSPAQLAL